MADKVRKATDKELAKLEKQISGIYKKSTKDLTKNWDAYMKESAKAINEYEKAYYDALKLDDAAKIKKAKKEFENAMLEQTFMDDHYRIMLDDMTTRLANTNNIALAYANDKMPEVYAMNYNAVAPTANSLGIDFSIVNEHTVRNMVKAGDIKLPYKNLNKLKDKRWNTKQLNSAVLQGIMQGESMDKIAKRIYPIVDRNEAAAIRNARTMVTGAENQGRLDSYYELQEEGAVIQKVWITTIDNRTRTSHELMNEEAVDIDEEFSNGLMYPGDPDGDDESEIYNCRCTMTIKVVGFKDNDGNINYL